MSDRPYGVYLRSFGNGDAGTTQIEVHRKDYSTAVEVHHDPNMGFFEDFVLAPGVSVLHIDFDIDTTKRIKVGDKIGRIGTEVRILPKIFDMKKVTERLSSSPEFTEEQYYSFFRFQQVGRSTVWLDDDTYIELIMQADSRENCVIVRLMYYEPWGESSVLKILSSSTYRDIPTSLQAVYSDLRARVRR